MTEKPRSATRLAAANGWRMKNTAPEWRGEFIIELTSGDTDQLVVP
jgi:hypothetical protein